MWRTTCCWPFMVQHLEKRPRRPLAHSGAQNVADAAAGTDGRAAYERLLRRICLTVMGVIGCCCSTRRDHRSSTLNGCRADPRKPAGHCSTSIQSTRPDHAGRPAFGHIRWPKTEAFVSAGGSQSDGVRADYRLLIARVTPVRPVKVPRTRWELGVRPSCLSALFWADFFTAADPRGGNVDTRSTRECNRTRWDAMQTGCGGPAERALSLPWSVRQD